MKPTRHRWTPEDDAILRALYPTGRNVDIAAQLGVTTDAAFHRARKLGLVKDNGRAWTDAQLAGLRRLYATNSAAEVAQAIGRSVESVQGKASKLGLKKSREWIIERARQAMLDPNHPGRKTGFQKGLIPWNAGMKGLDIGGKATRFQPGQRPHTWNPIGHTRETKDGYLQRKIADTGVTRRDYVMLHHLVWRMHNGTVPRGHALVFRDGDKRNIDINNLELITRAELMARNTVQRYPEPLKRAIRAKAGFVRKLNNIINAQNEATA